MGVDGGNVRGKTIKKPSLPSFILHVDGE